jgi:hypothetical protein
VYRAGIYHAFPFGGHDIKLAKIQFYGNQGNDSFKVLGSLEPRHELVIITNTDIEAYGGSGDDTLTGSSDSRLTFAGKDKDSYYDV